jgi:hypothetical protein
MSTLNLKATIAILDIEKGRGNLNKALCHSHIPITIRGYIVDAFGDWDGVSQEFTIRVDGIETGHPVKIDPSNPIRNSDDTKAA